ncbi:heparan-alpha-glucosaminide N-acetyltransferase domain-containing protein [Streptomyces sp. NBC_00237]|uniref:heparan-alpha-glucosaminide N-acetyltransferase domain-containing protein n=1 Tax=Streptomyces sp. NBC_00237 TaxID=2975687 RepID=UPI002253B2B5|nr:heparan-alpha-glucosaminide N-acetyltransferase domain-containing protein [Streptomyces sp. NBC_00237]MCX5205261.1 heparan-alpha-glucosaminide N-acetyltransferase domain-containing protein [Streptomyces sp. NBC_00237]
MTQTAPATASAPPVTPPAASAPARRLIGVDVARAVAILAMFAAHVGPDAELRGARLLMVAADGRAPAVFTLIAGFSLALANGGRQPRRTPGGFRAVAVRCTVLALLGLALAAPGRGILGILTFYAAYFLAAEPFTRLRPRALTVLAATGIVLGPVLSYVLGPLAGYRVSGRGGIPRPEDLTSFSGVVDLLDKTLLSGAYPFLTYFPYVVVGLALGRLVDVHRRKPAVKLAVWGTVTAVVGYGTSWLLVDHGGGRQAILEAIARHHAWALDREDPVVSVLARQFGAIPSTDWHWLLLSGPYSQTPFETLGNVGVGAALIGLCLLAVRVRTVATVLRPLAVVGTMALSVYTLHAIALFSFAHGVTGWVPLMWFCVAALVGCWVWERCFATTALRYGPLESALRALTRATARKD